MYRLVLDKMVYNYYIPRMVYETNPKNELVLTSFKVRKWQKDAIKAQAAYMNISQAEVVRIALEHYYNSSNSPVVVEQATS